MNENIERILYNPKFILSASVVTSFGAGVAAGWFLRSRQTEAEVIQLKESHPVFLTDVFEKIAEDVNPKEAIQKAFEESPLPSWSFTDTEIRQAAEKAHIVPKKEEVTQEYDNVFLVEDEWDPEEEVRNRVDGYPYIIHRDEWFLESEGYSRHTLTYYDGDNTLVDEQGSPIYGIQDVVGDLNFGHGSDDPGVCFVRNEKLRAEYEVLLHTGMYATEVLGLIAEDEREQDELKHTQRRHRLSLE